MFAGLGGGDSDSISLDNMFETIADDDDADDDFSLSDLIGDNDGYADRSEAEELLLSEFTIDEE